jgi:hypothetical protein
MEEAWAPWFSHEYIAYFTLQAIEELMGLPPVPVRPNPYRHDPSWPVGPRHIDLYKESYTDTGRLDAHRCFDYGQRNAVYASEPPTDKQIEPWKVLVIYSTEPDLLPDHDLVLHKRQKVTGGSHGWRHMQFKAFGITFGMAPESFRRHRDVAFQAFAQGNDYWGWRYLSRSMHYLADLGHPFHVKAAPSWFLARNILSFRNLFQTLSALHTGFEIYTEMRFRQGIGVFKEALMSGAYAGYASENQADAWLEEYIRRARRRLGPIFCFMLEEYGRELIDVYSRVDPASNADAAAQTRQCSQHAAEVLFHDAHLAALGFLDKITSEVLFDVGKMLGMMLSRIRPSTTRDRDGLKRNKNIQVPCHEEPRYRRTIRPIGRHLRVQKGSAIDIHRFSRWGSKPAGQGLQAMLQPSVMPRRGLICSAVLGYHGSRPSGSR